MPNANYLKGRRLEYKAKKQLELEGWKVLRSAGSHGAFDLSAFRKDLPAYVIQVKSTDGGMPKVAALIKGFRKNPPWEVCKYYTQAIWVWDGKRWHWGLV